jgi:hypothetical protein
VVFPTQSPENGGGLRAAFSIHRHSGDRTKNPTHVVVDGIAYGLRPPTTTIAAGGNGRASDLSVKVTPAGVGACDILIDSIDGRWQASARLDGQLHGLPGAEAPLAPGDILEIHGAPGLVRLMFVTLSA